MSNEKPKEGRVAGVYLSFGKHDFCMGLGTHHDKSEALELIRRLQQFVDYEEPKWVPQPGDAYRIDEGEETHIRMREESDRFRARNGYAWTSFSLKYKVTSWSDGTRNYSPVELTAKDKEK